MRPRPGPPLLLLQHHPAGRGRDVTAASPPPAAGTRRARLKRHRPPPPGRWTPRPAPPLPAAHPRVPEGRWARRQSPRGRPAPTSVGPRIACHREPPRSVKKCQNVILRPRWPKKMDILMLSAKTLPRPESSLFSFLIVKGMNSRRPTPKSVVRPGRRARMQDGGAGPACNYDTDSAYSLKRWTRCWHYSSGLGIPRWKKQTEVPAPVV